MLEIVLNFNAKMLSFKIRKKSSINLELKLVNSALGHINVTSASLRLKNKKMLPASLLSTSKATKGKTKDLLHPSIMIKPPQIS